VRFDIEDDGAARAVRVTLRRGTRTSLRQHRFWSLAGARRVDAKAGAPFGRPHPEVGHALVTRPLLVVETWAERLAQRDLDVATHGDLAAVRPWYVDRPPEERQLVRHKTFAIGELTPDEAAFDMSQLDYDVHLFRDLASGEDAVIERLPDDTYRLTRLRPTAVEPGPTAIALTVEETPPPELTVGQAIANLDDSGRRWLFFADADSGRGHVVYRRYDGHYGLITPA